jgi:hypothetical protein
MKKKPNLQVARKKMIDRFVSAGSVKPGEVTMPLAHLCTTFCNVEELVKLPLGQARLKTAIPRMVRAFLEFDADSARAQAAEARLAAAMVDLNELRVTPAIEVAAILGSRYPFSEHRSSLLHRALQSIYERENQMSLASLQNMKKAEIRNYLKTLAGMTPYVEAVVGLECFDVTACPMDTKLLLWLISKGLLDERCTTLEAQQTLEREIIAKRMHNFYLGSRKELEDWAPKTWPPVAKVPSPVLAPPTVVAPPVEAPPDPKPAAKARTPKSKPITLKKAAAKK